MSDTREEGKSATAIEGLLPQATQVYINYAIGGQLELAGKGTPALAELVQRFGQQGTDAFNRAFINPDFEQRIVNRMRNLTNEIVAFEPESDAWDISRIRGQLDAERGALEDLLESLRRGEEVSISIRNDRERNSQQGAQFGKLPAGDRIFINLKNPSRPSVSQPNS